MKGVEDKQLKKKDFLRADFKAKATHEKEEELPEGAIYLGWTINPMTCEKFKVYRIASEDKTTLARVRVL